MKRFIAFLHFIIIAVTITSAQNVGINNNTPQEKLDVVGNAKISDTLKTNNYFMSPNSGTGKVLTSDAIGNGTWQTIPKPTTNVTGYVRLLDFYGNAVVTGLAGTIVTIEGTSNSTITDSNGKFTFTNLVGNYYTFVASKTGYGSDKLQGVSVVGGGADYYLGSIKLSQIPSFNPTSITSTLVSGDIVFSGSTSGITNYKRTVAAFISTSASVSSSNYIYFINNNINAGNSNYTITLTAPMMATMGIPSGTTLYCKVYSINFELSNSSSYTDLLNGKKVYTALGTTPTVAFSFVKP